MNQGTRTVPLKGVSCGSRFGALLTGVALLLVVSMLLPGCGLLRAPQQVVTAVVPTGKSNQPDPVDLQLQLQRYTDDFLSRSAEALDEYAGGVGTEPARVEALRLKLTGGSSVLSIASGPNPNANLLDMVSVTVLTRMVVEDYWMKTTNGPAFQPWLDASRRLEHDVWQIAAGFLKPSQTNELGEGINQWYGRNPEARSAFLARPHQFASMMRTGQEKSSALNSVFSLVSLDPTAGLDPAVREVTRTRLFAERAMFTLQRMPFLLRLQTELLAHELAGQSEIHMVLTNTVRLADSADRISRAAESVSRTAAQLPDRLSTERKEILAALAQQEGKLRELAAEVDRSLVHADQMSSSLNITITNFNALMKRFGVGEPTTSAMSDTNSRPFNILDYGTVAGQISGMARDLNTLVTSVDQSVPQLTQVSQQAAAEANRIVSRAFRMGLTLILVLLVGSVLAALAYRILANKLNRHRRASSPPEP